MTHFIQTSGLNTLRFPVSWQFLSNNKPDGSLDSAKFAVYDKLMQSCISGASKLCVIDLHNYGRFEGQIIGQGGPANDAFAGLWTQLAQKYKAAQKVAFGLMNEPHDLDVGAWAQTVQAAVTAIRNAGAQQMILLPGSNFSSAGAFLDNGSAGESVAQWY
jgi:endoglucanase